MGTDILSRSDWQATPTLGSLLAAFAVVFGVPLLLVLATRLASDYVWEAALWVAARRRRKGGRKR